MSIRWRWTAALLTVSVLPLAIIAPIVIRVQRRGLESAEKLHQIAIVDHVTDVVEQQLNAAADGTQAIGEILTDPRIENDESKIELAREALARAPALLRVSIYVPDGRLADTLTRRDAAGLPEPPDTLTLPETTRGLAGQWLPVEFVARPGHDTLPLVRYVDMLSRDGEVRAVLVATIDAASLSTLVASISRDRFDARADGVLIVDNSARILASGATHGALTVGDSIVGRDLIGASGVAPRVFSANRPLSASTTFTAADGERMVGTLRTLPERGWAIVIRRPEAAVFADLAAARRSFVIAIASLAVLSILVGAWIGSRTVRPIMALVRLAQSYARREFDQRSPVRTGDELESLGESLSDMADSLVASDKEIARRIVVENDLSRYLPAPIAQAIAKGERSLELGGEHRTISVLFADVASFTSFAEAAPPEKVVAFLNELFRLLTEIVFRHGGTVDKFVGDSIVALFGAPEYQDDHAQRALAAAEDMHRFVEASGTEWGRQYGFAPKLAIGINSGDAVVGNLGSTERMEYTAIGDVVNVAARLEAIALPAQTLVTAEVARSAPGAFTFRSLGEQSLRGKTHPVEVFETSP